MAGHSKWANIKHRKGRADAKKGKIFSRLAKEIISAVKLGGDDPKSNPRLRLAIVKAREANFPSENIERNIKKAMSDDQEAYSEVTYELYGHGGVGIIVDIMTDNRNRSSSDMRIATNKKGGNIAMPGAVAFNFDRKGIIQINKTTKDNKPVNEDDLFLAATEAGAEDFEVTEQGFVIVTDPADLFTVKEALQQNFECQEAELMMIPKNTITCNEDAKANIALMEWLEDLEDVDAVHHNMKEE
jgi:YebC/PmpR family DNA-binding regulatory protein